MLALPQRLLAACLLLLAASGAAASLFAVTTAAGVALALIRRGRVLFWSAIGLLLIATHPADPESARKGLQADAAIDAGRRTKKHRNI